MEGEPAVKNRGFGIIFGSILLLGVFAFALGLGVMFFGEQKTDDVRIISAQNYDDFELDKGKVAGESVGNVVNVNSATAQELEALPGIGPVTAGKIIAGRPYNSVEELLIKNAIGRALYEKIGSQLTATE